MNKLVVSVLLLLFPILALADGALSFAPPPSDVSVVFLGNLFGIVDGVLHGGGSQIMGAMFAVFNAAVLSLGGIVIMYTLMVSTMNTAHEGQMLGQKWSSIWIPVRSTLGLVLLIPKASGYCLMQIFIMWIVVQGVGAADKVWEAALDYLNRGGVIIQAQPNPGTALVNASAGKDKKGVAYGAYTILLGQVCMLGLQKHLETIREKALKDKNGPCSKPSADAKGFCDTAIPDFISSVNAVNAQSKGQYSVNMPNIETQPYSRLNGICGQLQWTTIQGLPASGSSSAGNISSSQMTMIQASRAIAIQQMYSDFIALSTIIVNNNPMVSNRPSAGKFSEVAQDQFGVPHTANGIFCEAYNNTCTTWGPDNLNNKPSVLFNGTEFQGAISDYNAIMAPTLNLIKLTAQAASNNDARGFITQAKNKGWMMAGSYFFDLVRLNGNAVESADNNSEANAEVFAGSAAGFNGLTSSACTTYAPLCTWLNINSADEGTRRLKNIQMSIDGRVDSTIPTPAEPKFDIDSIRSSKAVNGAGSSSVYGFVTNSLMVQLPGQPGIAPLQFANMIHFQVDPQTYYLKQQDFDCGEVKVLFFSFCLGRMMGNLFYNAIFRYIYNAFLAVFSQIIYQVVMAFLMIPLQGMADIFKQGLHTLNQPGINPIVALANMGVMYINFSSNLWLLLLNLAVTSAIIPIFGPFIFALIALAMPLLLAWVGVMVSVGFITAFYIPILPYMIFTFGTLGWLLTVIEAMVAAPIVALGVTHPEGHDAFGKAEQAIMIIMNIFLRPALMIIGYIAAIALSYVGVWIMNEGFQHAIGFIQSAGPANPECNTAWGMCGDTWTHKEASLQEINSNNSLPKGSGSGSGGYTDWAGIYAYFFSILIYTSMYLTIVQKSFTLISALPDKVLRWIGATQESTGQEAAQWGEEVKGKVERGGEKTQEAQNLIGSKLGGYGQKALSSAKKPGGAGEVKGKGESSGGGGESTPPPAPPA